MAESTTTDKIKLPEKSEFAKFYALQNNNICQQENARKRIGDLIKILNSFSNKVGKWKESWISFDSKHEKRVPDYQSTWALFRITTSSIAGYTESIADILENLKNIHQSIPVPDYNQRLEVKIKEARKEMDSLAQNIDKLTQQKIDLEQKIDKMNKKPSKNLRSCVSPESPLDDYVERQSSTDTLIQEKEASLRRKLTRFERDKANFYKNSRTEEIERCKELKQHAKEFLEAFNLSSKDFDSASTKYDSEADFTEWEKKNPPPISKQLQRSQSLKTKDIAE